MIVARTLLSWRLCTLLIAAAVAGDGLALGDVPPECTVALDELVPYPTAIRAKVEDAVLHLTCSGKQGTGYIIDGDGLILTAYHVVKAHFLADTQINASHSTYPGDEIVLERVHDEAFSLDSDLALLKPKDQPVRWDFTPIDIVLRPPRIEGGTYTVGYPGVSEGQLDGAPGSYSGKNKQKRRVVNKMVHYWTSFSGFSGSPLFGRHGLAFATLVEEPEAPNQNWASLNQGGVVALLKYAAVRGTAKKLFERLAEFEQGDPYDAIVAQMKNARNVDLISLFDLIETEIRRGRFGLKRDLTACLDAVFQDRKLTSLGQDLHYLRDPDESLRTSPNRISTTFGAERPRIARSQAREEVARAREVILGEVRRSPKEFLAGLCRGGLQLPGSKAPAFGHQGGMNCAGSLV